ncbi:MAG: rare lipoprotein [Candidatus Atribacteria bacterium]|nr:rare lipoprotein [Candidatus Atribacteria bacterium]
MLFSSSSFTKRLIFVLILGLIGQLSVGFSWASTEKPRSEIYAVYDQESDISSIFVEDRLLFRIRFEGEEESVKARSDKIVSSLRQLFCLSPSSKKYFYLVSRGGKLDAMYHQMKLFTVFEEDAQVNNSNLINLASMWLSFVQIEFYDLRENYQSRVLETFEGYASWYGAQFKNRLTANGEKYDPLAFTCAHRSLPFGSLLLITNLSNGKKVLVKVNDRGPNHQGRELDLSLAAARALTMKRVGVQKIKVEVISYE